MNTTDDKTDIKFKKLFQRTGLESPSEGFTSKLMKQIEQLDAVPMVAPENNTRSNWYWSIGLSMLVVLGFSIMYYFDIGLLPETFKPILTPVFAGVFQSFEGIFASVQISSTTVVIILGFVLLVAVERILNKLKLTKNIYLSF